MFKNLIPKVFYADLQDGLEFFVEGLGFTNLYQDENMAVVGREGAKAYLVANAQCAALDRPELSIDTENIDTIYAEMKQRCPNLLHPNSKSVTTRPWGSREFAMLDKTTVCIVFREWPNEI